MKDLGNKFTCYKCQTKFYDMKKPAPICPKCGADQRDTPPQTKSERKKATAVAAPTRLEAVEDYEEKVPEDEEDEEEGDEAEEDEDA
jgi:uncharacterized protein (TIGR02300 family)